MPDLYNHSSVIPDVVNRPSVIPDVVNHPSVIPDVCNRESMAFPHTGPHPNKGTEEKNPGFPLKTCGNDRGARAGMTKGPGWHDVEQSRHDKGTRLAWRVGQSRHSVMPDMYNHPSVIPDVCNRESKERRDGAGRPRETRHYSSERA